MFQSVISSPDTAKSWVRARVSACVIYGGQSGTATGFLRFVLLYPVNIIPPWLHTHVPPGR
jgi:hypothetical protein